MDLNIKKIKTLYLFNCVKHISQNMGNGIMSTWCRLQSGERVATPNKGNSHG